MFSMEINNKERAERKLQINPSRFVRVIFVIIFGHLFKLYSDVQMPFLVWSWLEVTLTACLELTS